MRSLPKFVMALAVAAVAGACVISVEAVVPEASSNFDPRLIGTWQGDGSDSTDRARVSRGRGNLYEIEYSDKGNTGKFEARLGRLGTRWVLDVWPMPADSDVAEPYRGLMIPGHTLLAIDVGATTITTAMLDPDSLRNAIKRGRSRLDTLRYGRQMVLTSSTNGLRAALGTYLARAGVLEKPGIWKRVRNSR